MTQETLSIIKNFMMTQDIADIPTCILRMQEEDNVGNVIEFKNCMRQLRNIAAHEPSTITSQLLVGDNTNNVKLVFKPESGNIVALDTVQFTAWMFSMYLRTENMGYLWFWKGFMKVVYPKIASGHEVRFKFGAITDKVSLLKQYLAWKNYRFEEYGDIKNINIYDPYITQLIKDNPKVFWRVALVDMFSLVRDFLTGKIDYTSRANIQAFLALFVERE